MAGKPLQRKLTMTMSSTKLGKMGRARAKSMTGAMFDEEDFEDEVKGKDEEQLVLTEKQLKEEFTRVLTSENPNVVKNVVVYNYKDMAYKQEPVTDHCVYHLDIQSTVYNFALETAARETRKRISKVVEHEEPPADEFSTNHKNGLESGDQLHEGKKPLPNKFNFCNRAAQTYNLPVRHRENQTIPPPREVIIGNVSQGDIYDAYYDHAETLAKKGKPRQEIKETPEAPNEELNKLALTIKIMERMVNQNIYDEIMQDFKYWEDQADDFRSPEGMLLPLWKFAHDSARSLSVTALQWNPKYDDLFAATYGSLDYMKQHYGMICIHSLKNPAFPEYLYTVDSGVLCLDTNPDQPNLIAVGCYDGNVFVFDIMRKSNEPKYKCDPKGGKHHNPVWKVKWQEINLDGMLNFVSVSSDGRITNWILFKTDLRFHDLILLTPPQPPLEGPGGAELDIKGSGTSIAFHRVNKSLFLLGTEEGIIHRCSRVYSNRLLQSYMAHSMAVHEIQWNIYHPDIYITCSADWTVKIWDYQMPRPLFVFDLGSSVADVAWAPYSATVFAACTSEGKVAIFDLNINKYKSICEQIVVQKRGLKLCSVAFNKRHPIIAAGDTKGFTTCLKLSPNLRKAIKENKTTEVEKYRELELAKLGKILAVVRLSTE